MSDVSKLTRGEPFDYLPLAVVAPDLVENPLANYPDTDECLCGSGHIWRRCHKQQMITFIPKDEAEKAQAFLDRKARAKKSKAMLKDNEQS